MNEKTEIPGNSVDTILLVEHDVLVRTAIAEYLRHCGYDVIEATSADEAVTALRMPDIPINIVFSAVELGEGMDGFGLAQWVRASRPGTQIILTGNVVKEAHTAGDLCDDGPHLKKAYEPQQVVEWIKRLRHS